MFWKKKKPAHKICIGLETKRCSECHGPQRPCLVDGRPATFHCFAVEEKGLLLIDDANLTDEDVKRIREAFHEAGIVHNCCKVEKLGEVRAIVEYPDGSVGKVPAEWIEFIDNEQHRKQILPRNLERLIKDREPTPSVTRKEDLE